MAIGVSVTGHVRPRRRNDGNIVYGCEPRESPREARERKLDRVGGPWSGVRPGAEIVRHQRPAPGGDAPPELSVSRRPQRGHGHPVQVNDFTYSELYVASSVVFMAYNPAERARESD